MNAHASRAIAPRHAALLGALVFALGAVFAIVHRSLGLEYPHFTHLHDVVVDAGLAVFWLAAAFALLARPGSLSRTGAVIVGVGIFLMFLHGVMFSVSKPRAGIAFLLAVPFLVWCAREDFAGFRRMR
jgi:hypothetical protein